MIETGMARQKEIEKIMKWLRLITKQWGNGTIWSAVNANQIQLLVFILGLDESIIQNTSSIKVSTTERCGKKTSALLANLCANTRHKDQYKVRIILKRRIGHIEHDEIINAIVSSYWQHN